MLKDTSNLFTTLFVLLVAQSVEPLTLLPTAIDELELIVSVRLIVEPSFLEPLTLLSSLIESIY